MRSSTLRPPVANGGSCPRTSHPIKTTESGGPRGYDAGKKIKGRKRHIVTDTEGNLVGLVVHEATFRTAMAPRASLLRSAAPHLRRWWLCRRETALGLKAHRRMDDRNHQTFRHGAGLRSSAAQMGCRTYFRMARSLSQTGKRFRSDHRQRCCLGVRRPHPNPHAATRKSLKSNEIIVSRTLRPCSFKAEAMAGTVPFPGAGLRARRWPRCCLSISPGT
jgi:hypothetical protein